MSYGNAVSAMKSCEPEIEERIKRLNKSIKVDSYLIKAIHKFIDHNGSHMLRDIQMSICYSEVKINVRKAKAERNELIKLQMKKRPKLKRNK